MLGGFCCVGKSVRRRAASMEAAKLEKRRGRFKKNIEAVKNGTIGSEYTNLYIISNEKKYYYRHQTQTA